MLDPLEKNLPIEEEATKRQATEVEIVNEDAKKDMPLFTTTAEVIARLKTIAEQSAELIDKAETDLLKVLFYKFHQTAKEKAKTDFVANGGTEAEFKYEGNNEEQTLKDLLVAIKNKRGELVKKEQLIKEQNLAIKLTIVERLKKLLENPEEANKAYQEVKDMQKQWNEAKSIPAEKANELWKNYQHCIEQYYDILKLNHEFRDYDFKKNLQIKTRLCETAEKLVQEEDIISAFHQLQNLHQEYRSTGPVAKELRDEIWKRFKEASTEINRRHQQHFEEKKQKEAENLVKKTAICERMEALLTENIGKMSGWDKKTKEVLALQKEWKTIGYTPKKMNTKIYERFRTACDLFFAKKSEFYKSMKDLFATNYDKKVILCEKAEALKDSTDWKITTDKLIALQKEWKTVGAVQKKHSDILWKRFVSACDYFFAQRNKQNESQHTIEKENLIQKQALIERLKAIGENIQEESHSEIREIIKQWNNIGHVPYKNKNTVYKAFHGLVDDLFEKLHINASNERLESFKSSLDKNSENNLYREREKLVRIHDRMKNEISTYENNIGFLTSASKNGNKLVTDIARKVEKLHIDLKLVIQKIDAIDASLKEK